LHWLHGGIAAEDQFKFLKKYTSAIVLFFAIMNFIFFFLNRLYEFSFPYLALAGYTTFAMMLGLLVNQAVTKETKLINFIFNILCLNSLAGSLMAFIYFTGRSTFYYLLIYHNG
jgi:hypothetical protein